MARNTKEQRFEVASAIIAERWHMASTKLEEFVDEVTPSYGNSDSIQGIYDNLHDLTYRMAGESATSRHEDEIEQTFQELMIKIECDLRDLAIRIELDRLSGPQVIAA